ncbi:MAG: oligosaccharide flippase family protein [Faecalibacterium sp.]
MADIQKKDKYSKLAGNTILFAISSFSAKLLSILIRPFVTNVLQDPAVVGVTTLATQCANLLIPVVSLGVSSAIIRFTLDKTNNKKQVFTNGLLTILAGYLLLWLFYPIVQFIPSVSDYAIYLYIYVLTSCLRSLCTNFVRGRQHNVLAAVDGVLCTLITLLFWVVFLIKYEMGAAGYLLAIICADVCSAIFLFCAEKLWRFLDFKAINKKLWGDMLKFALPMIPAQISFWVINASDMFFLQILADGRDGLSGSYWVGVFSTAYYLPTILSTIGVIFYEAWQLSAVTEEEDRKRFFGQVFRSYSGILFCVAAGILWLCEPLMGVFLEEFQTAWRCVPFLAIAAMITCFNQFYNSIYVVYKHTIGSCITMVTGAVANCIMNFFFIQWWGTFGAALASMLSLMIVFLFRVLHSRQFLVIDIAPRKVAINLAALLLETLVLLSGMPYAMWVAFAITAGVIVFNWAAVWQMGSMMIIKLLGRHGKALVNKLEGLVRKA